MTRGPGWKYPARKRCLKCGKFFVFLVVDGLYDSYECAGRPEVSEEQKEWPRQHYTWDRRQRDVKIPKRAWENKKAAIEAAKRSKMEAYVCVYCQEWHIGSRRRNG